MKLTPALSEKNFFKHFSFETFFSIYQVEGIIGHELNWKSAFNCEQAITIKLQKRRISNVYGKRIL